MATHRVRLARSWLLTGFGWQEHGYSPGSVGKSMATHRFGGVAMLLLTEPTELLKFKSFPLKMSFDEACQKALNYENAIVSSYT
jgi:hypothetical protein